MNLSGLNPRADFVCPSCGQEVTSDEAHAHSTKTIIEAYARYDRTYKCLSTGHPVGTDTRPLGAPCGCAVCQLVEENVQLRIELDRPAPSPSWAELDNLIAEHEQTLNELALYTNAHHDCLAGDDNCADPDCRAIRALIDGSGNRVEESTEPAGVDGLRLQMGQVLTLLHEGAESARELDRQLRAVFSPPTHNKPVY